MSSLMQLAWAWLWQRKTRSLLTMGAIAIACSLIVFTIDAWRGAAASSKAFAQQLLGPYDVMVSPRFAINPIISSEYENALRQLPEIKNVDRVQVVWANIEDVKDTTYYDSWRAGFFASKRLEPPVALAAGKWIGGESAIGSAVLSGGLAKKWDAKIGELLPVVSPGGPATITIIGITAEEVAHPKASGLWVSPQTLERLAGQEGAHDRLYVQLNDRSHIAQLLPQLQKSAKQADPPVDLANLTTLGEDLQADDAFKPIRTIGGAGAGIAIIIAFFIIAATSSAGVTERMRQLAMLRTIGASRGQVAGAFLSEAILLALGGSGIGIILGALFLSLFAALQPSLFHQGLFPSFIGIISATSTAILAALVAASIPAWLATRSNPLQALNGAGSSRSAANPTIASIIAVTFALVGIIAITTAPTVPIVAILALLCFAIAALCAALPLAELSQEILASCLGPALKIPQQLLQDQARLNPGRTTATILTLSVCLAGSVTMNVWGRTMVIPFLPSPDLPDAVISIRPIGIPDSACADIRRLEGVQPNRVLPMAVKQTFLGMDLINRLGGDVSKGTILIIGVDPQLALAGDKPLLPLIVETDNQNEAIKSLAQTGQCFIPPSLAEKLALQVGDSLPLLQDSIDGKPLTVGALASLPGWHWVTKLGEMRSLSGKPLAPVVVSRETARKLGLDRIRHCYVDLTANAQRNQLRKDVTTLAEAYAQTGTNLGVNEKVTVKVTDTRDVAQRLQTRADSVIWVLGALPLASLLVAMLGVANAIAASIRARTWEFGVLRAIGLEGRQTGRLLLLEASIIAGAAILLSVPLGISAAWAGVGVSLGIFSAGGTIPPLIIPWLDIILACMATMAATLLAAWLPARRLAKQSALDLLQAGRSAG